MCGPSGESPMKGSVGGFAKNVYLKTNRLHDFLFYSGLLSFIFLTQYLDQKEDVVSRCVLSMTQTQRLLTQHLSNISGRYLILFIHKKFCNMFVST